ncbi:hypothetical protein WJX72_004297 [[Myrmecia] bisecta]|uniref:AAA+ ATPase domain-containing protein n=1 Tax=[Myrmecia] bisecta TaxID=41462 RepID=A0AAW1PW17_9CHLO
MHSANTRLAEQLDTLSLEPSASHAQHHAADKSFADTPFASRADRADSNSHAASSGRAGAGVPQATAAGGSRAEHKVAGLTQALAALRELIGWPLMYADEATAIGVCWPRGLLLHGPPGCGKTLLVRSVAQEFGALVHSVSAASIFGAYTGESEQRLREAFEAAHADAAAGRPTVVFLDEIDALCPRRDAGKQHEARVVAQLLTLLDGAGGRRASAGHLSVVAATNRPNAIDPALRRPGRLDREVAISVPNLQDRAAILQLHARALPLGGNVDLAGLAAACHGYSGADLAALCREAAMHAMASDAEAFLEGRSDSAGVSLTGHVSQGDFQAAMQRVGPSITRGSEVDVPAVRWEDIGGLEEVKRRLQQAVEWPLLHEAAFKRLGLAPPRGVLLHGPPGCCKTTLARAAATASKATLLALSGAQLYSMYVGEGEALLRDIFKRARLAAPSIVFLDEVDAVAGRRAEGQGTANGGGGAEAGVRLLSALLTEMDGMELATGVLVLAATNRPQAIDPALMRPGRFDLLLYVPPPDAAGRLQTLQIHTRSMPLAADVDLQALADSTDLFTGAELEGLCREAAIAALREDLEGASEVAARHFHTARAATRAALTAQQLQQFASWGARSR